MPAVPTANSRHAPRQPSGAGRAVLAALAIGLPLLTGCAGHSNRTPVHLLRQGEFGRARAIIAKQLPKSRDDRLYLLDRMKLGIVTLADGYPKAAEVTFQEVYEFLRTQGLNKDKTVQSVVLYEGIKTWKGEPFEQAMGLCYIGIQQAMQQQWGNARAASE